MEPTFGLQLLGAPAHAACSFGPAAAAATASKEVVLFIHATKHNHLTLTDEIESEFSRLDVVESIAISFFLLFKLEKVTALLPYSNLYYEHPMTSWRS